MDNYERSIINDIEKISDEISIEISKSKQLTIHLAHIRDLNRGLKVDLEDLKHYSEVNKISPTGYTSTPYQGP